MHDQPTKPTVMQVRRSRPGITAQMVAEQAGVPLATEFLMEIGGAVAREDAEKVIHALSQLTGIHHTIDTIGGFSVREETDDYLDHLRQKGNIKQG